MEKMCAYVINLKRRPDRLENFYRRCNLPKENIKLINAFDGKHYESESETEKYLYSRLSNKLLPGEKGCFISHIMAYKEVVKNDEDFAIIFEDDCFFCDDFVNKINTVIGEMPKDTQILYIGGRETPDFKMNMDTCEKISENIVAHKCSNWYNRDWNNHDRCAYGYIISKKLAAQFVSYCENDYNFNFELPALDHWIIKTCLDNNITIYNSYPLLCFSKVNVDSDIR